MKIKNFRDVLAILLIVLIIALWVLDGKDIIALNEGVSGALVAIFTLVAQFYFRKAQSESN